MELEHIKNDRVDEARVVHEEKTIRNQPSSDKIFGRSIIFLKQVPDRLKRMEGFMRLSCICKIKLLKIPPVYVMIHKYPCEVFHK